MSWSLCTGNSFARMCLETFSIKICVTYRYVLDFDNLTSQFDFTVNVNLKIMKNVATDNNDKQNVEGKT